MLDHILVPTAALGAVTSASLAILLMALRLVAWDVVPTSALPHVRWWHRHTRTILLTTLAFTIAAVLAMVAVR